MARAIILHPDRDNDRVGGSFVPRTSSLYFSLTLRLALILITPMNKCINIIARFTPTRLCVARQRATEKEEGGESKRVEGGRRQKIM